MSWIKTALSEIKLPKMKKKETAGEIPLPPLPQYQQQMAQPQPQTVQPVQPVQPIAPQPQPQAAPVQPAPQQPSGQEQVEVTIEDVIVDIHKQVSELRRDFDAYLRLKLK